MAYYPNPYYGSVPGAPQALNAWLGNQFVMSGLPVPTPAPLPPVSTAATPTPQDAAAQSAFVQPRTDTGGAQPGGGGPGSGPGGLGGASGGGQDRTTSGYQGVYAQSPMDIDSRFGQAGGLLGMGIGGMAGVPGIGTALGIGGAAVDAARYNGTLAQYGLPGNVSVPGSMAAAALASVGIPFTNYDLAHLFGVPTARERMDAVINGLAPGLYNDQGFSAIAANQPNNPSAPFGNTGWGPGMNPTTSQYPPGFFENEARLAGAAPAAPVDKSTAAFTEADLAGWADAMAGKGGTAADMGQSTGYGGDKGAVGAGQEGGSGGTSSAGGGSKGGDPNAGLYARGGLIGAPPGRYAAGGQVPPTPGDNITPAQFGALRAINPPGPDDQIGALQTGEGVVTKAAMARYPGLLAAVNAGTLDPGRVKGLLTPAGMGRKPRLIR